jgi:AraC family transcriptional regulator
MSKIGKDLDRRARQKSRMSRTATLDPVDQELVIAAEAARALDFIEANLFGPLTVERIAQHCNASAFHFSRRFTRRQGESVMAYVRGRRLDIAAQRLANGQTASLAQLALDCRFETQAAFTRAFTRAFGVAPGAFRKAAIPRKRKLSMAERPDLHENLADEGPIRFAGLSGNFDPSSYVRIPELWKRFNALMMGWPGKLGGTETVGVFYDRDLIARSFRHLAAVRVAPDARLPAEFEVMELPAQTWLKFHQPMTTAELHVQLITAEADIRDERLPKSGRKLRGAPDLQIYAANFRTAPGWWVEHWLPVE